MESLVLTAATVVVGLLAASAVSALLAWRPRRSLLGRACAIVVGSFTALAGAWLASLQIGAFLDTLGVFTCASGCIAVLRHTSLWPADPAAPATPR